MRSSSWWLLSVFWLGSIGAGMVIDTWRMEYCYCIYINKYISVSYQYWIFYLSCSHCSHLFQLAHGKPRFNYHSFGSFHSCQSRRWSHSRANVGMYCLHGAFGVNINGRNDLNSSGTARIILYKLYLSQTANAPQQFTTCTFVVMQ